MTELMISKISPGSSGGFWYELLRTDGSDPTRYEIGYTNAISPEDLIPDVFQTAVRQAIKEHDETTRTQTRRYHGNPG